MKGARGNLDVDHVDDVMVGWSLANYLLRMSSLGQQESIAIYIYIYICTYVCLLLLMSVMCCVLLRIHGI